MPQVEYPFLAHDILKGLSGACLDDFGAMEVFDILPSTQLALQSRASMGHEWVACVAHHQSAGFGRQGRVWQSAPGQLALSWRGWVAVPDHAIGLLSFAAALAVADALRAFGVESVRFKWPNDIYIEEKKLAGLLISVCQLKKNSVDAILGVGLNRLHVSLPEQAIALADIIAQPPILSDVIAQLLMAWHRWKAFLLSEDGRNVVCNAWLAQALWLNASVRVLLHNNVVNGVFVGITSSGLLRIATDDGEKIFAAGEVQLRLLD